MKTTSKATKSRAKRFRVHDGRLFILGELSGLDPVRLLCRGQTIYRFEPNGNLYLSVVEIEAFLDRELDDDAANRRLWRLWEFYGCAALMFRRRQNERTQQCPH